MESPDLDRDLLFALTSYYGTSEAEAIERIAREGEAKRIHQPIKLYLGDAYAGAWFDDQTLELAVAVTDPAKSAMVSRFGGRPEVVEHGLAQLNDAADQVGRETALNTTFGEAVTGWYVDYPTNSVVVEAFAEQQEYVQTHLAAIIEEIPVQTVPTHAIPRLANDVRGADCYKNTDRETSCPMGFAVVDGFVTAGHCGAVLDLVSSCGDVSMGTFEGSTWHSAPSLEEIEHDGGWVETDSPWQPVPKVNGYNDGILDVPADFSGYAEAVVYSTVCRYGQTSEGPHCGTILAKNQSQEFCVNPPACDQKVTLVDVARTDACVEFGDSGGPFITASSKQAQGTTVGGYVDTCPDDPEAESFYEPVANTLDHFQLTMLTTHGSNPPDITTFVCPNWAASGEGSYVCSINYDSQGPTAIDWTTNTYDSSDTVLLTGTCNQSQTVNVDVLVTNDYGTDDRSVVFLCPSGPYQ